MVRSIFIYPISDVGPINPMCTDAAREGVAWDQSAQSDGLSRTGGAGRGFAILMKDSHGTMSSLGS